MSVCSGIRADGGRCGAQAIRGEEHCVSHHPDYEAARRRRNSKGGKRGGRGRPRVELSNIKTQLQDLADGVLDGSVERGDASVVGQLLNIVLRAITVDLQVREQEELIGRLEDLEAALEARNSEGNGVGTWPA
jgi:hypothetical protein